MNVCSQTERASRFWLALVLLLPPPPPKKHSRSLALSHASRSQLTHARTSAQRPNAPDARPVRAQQSHHTTHATTSFCLPHIARIKRCVSLSVPPSSLLCSPRERGLCALRAVAGLPHRGQWRAPLVPVPLPREAAQRRAGGTRARERERAKSLPPLSLSLSSPLSLQKTPPACGGCAPGVHAALQWPADTFARRPRTSRAGRQPPGARSRKGQAAKSGGGALPILHRSKKLTRHKLLLAARPLDTQPAHAQEPQGAEDTHTHAQATHHSE